APTNLLYQQLIGRTAVRPYKRNLGQPTFACGPCLACGPPPVRVPPQNPRPAQGLCYNHYQE
ncbi:MAG: hypothetical protein ACE1Z2_06695, partial [Acidobacteriota bacterium]